MISIVPLIPKIGASFDVDYGTAQLTLSVYFAFFAIAQLVLGPISDRVGRRPVMVGTAGLFVVGSVMSAVSPDFSLVLLGRGLQACGAAAGVVVTRAIIFDVYGRDKSAQLISYMAMGMVVGPMVAPSVAGVLATTIGWQYLFWLLAVVGGGATLGLVAKLPETRWYGEQADTPSKGLLEGVPLLRHRIFLSYAGNWAFSSCVYFSFLAGAGFIVIETMGRSEAEYGVYFSVAAICYILGNFLSSQFAVRIGLLRCMRIGSVISLLATCLQWFLLDTDHTFLVFLPMMIVALAHGLIIPNAAASVMGVIPHLAGAASGLAGFLQIAAGALVTSLVGYLQHQYDYTMALAMSICAVISVLFLFFGGLRRADG